MSELQSPSLLIYPRQVRKNIQAMIAVAGSPDRLRPHVKTHKMAEIVRLAESLGIKKHKCATIAEAEMAAAAGATDVLLAYPLIGPNLKRFVLLVRGYRATKFRATVDHPDSARALSAAAHGLDSPIPVLVDLEIGMGRTGIQPGAAAAELYALVEGLPNLAADGLHAYDGQIHDTDFDARRHAAESGLATTLASASCYSSAGCKCRGWWSAERPPFRSTPGSMYPASNVRRGRPFFKTTVI